MSPRSFVLALASAPLLALAQNNPNPFNVPETGLSATGGQPLNLEWNPTTDGTVSLILRSGSSNNLEEGTVIACKYWVSKIERTSPDELQPPSTMTALIPGLHPTTSLAAATIRFRSFLTVTSLLQTTLLTSSSTPRTPSHTALVS